MNETGSFNRPQLPQDGDSAPLTMVVRPAKEMIAIADQRQAPGTRLVQIKPMHLVDQLTRIIDFQKYDKQSEDWFSIDYPQSIAAAYLERIGNWNLPVLTGITNAPTLRPGGSVLDQVGYKATGILYAPSGGYYLLRRH